MSTSTSVMKGAIRPMAVIALAILVLGVLVGTDSPATAKSSKVAVFGTAVSAPSDGKLKVATRKGVITLNINNSTKINNKKGDVRLNRVKAGTSVTGYYEEENNRLVASKLTFKERNAKKIFKHLVGVVIAKRDRSMTVQTPDGEEVTVGTSENEDDDETTEGSLVATVVEENLTTGELDAVAVRTAEETITRLNDAIGHEISLAQEKLLKSRMSTTASAHLTKLHDTLADIQSEAQEKIQAAYAEFEANYTTTLDANSLEPPTITISGQILSTSRDLIVVAKQGRRSYVVLPESFEILLADGSAGTTSDLQPDTLVEIVASPQTASSSPVAQTINVLPAPVVPDSANDASNDDDQTLSGTIVVVGDDESGGDTVIVIDSVDGTEGVAGVTPDTVVIGTDGELEPGQEVEVTLGEDGFSADEVEVVSPPAQSATPTPTTAAVQSTSPTPVPASSAQYTLIGTIKEISDALVVLDGVRLTLDTSSPVTGPLNVGEEIQFTVVVDENGRLVIVGVGP